MFTPRIHFLRKLSPAMVLAMLALVVALSGTAAAAGVLVTGKQIKDGTIQTVDISKRAQAQLAHAMSNGNSVEGSWVVTVTRLNPPPNVPPTFKSLMTFDSGGGLTETSNTGTTLRGPAHGSWESVEGRSYATTMLFFRFNPQTGAFLGTQRVSRTMRLSHDGQTFEAVSLAAQYDPDGVLTLGGLRATETGERIDVERIPDQP
jgi:hypothetical protein